MRHSHLTVGVRGRETDRHANTYIDTSILISSLTLYTFLSFFVYTGVKGKNQILCLSLSVCVSRSLSQPRSLIANFLAGPPSLASLHLGRDGSLTDHGPVGVSDGASALRSLSVSSTRGSCSSTHRSAGHASSASRAMAGSR